MSDLLAPRELQVARLAARGYTLNEIAAELELSSSTVRVYCERVKLKLGVARKNQIYRALEERDML